MVSAFRCPHLTSQRSGRRGRDDVQKKELSLYFHFGYHYNQLTLASVLGGKIHGDGGVMDEIKLFVEYVNEFGLKVTRQASENLLILHNKLSKSPQDAVADKAVSEELAQCLAAISPTLSAELSLHFAFILTPK